MWVTVLKNGAVIALAIMVANALNAASGNKISSLAA